MKMVAFLKNRIIGVLLVIELVLCSIVALSMSRTSDEHCHWLYGKKVLLGNPDRDSSEFDSKLPVTALNSVPIALGRQLQLYPLRNAPLRFLADTLADERSGRFVAIAFLLLLTWVLWRWTLELYGPHAAVAVVILGILEPNLIAHGTLNTTDLYVSLAFAGSCFTAWRFLRAPTASRALLAAVVLGLAPLTKFSALYLYPVLAVVITLALIFGRGQGTVKTVGPGLLALYTAGAVFFGLLFLNVGFEFRGTFTALSGYDFESAGFRSLQGSALAHIPLPLPVPFLQGLDMTKAHELTGKNFGNIYLLGETHDPKDANFKPFPAYYLVAYAVKEPLPLQILFCAGIFLLFRRRNWREFFARESFLLLPAIAVFGFFSFFNRAQIGIRHILPCLALFLPVCASCFANWKSMRLRQRTTLGALVGYAAVSVLLYVPHLIPYMNELVWDKKSSYKVLSDSNLDWQQNSWVVHDFLRHHPDIPLDPIRPTSGRVLASANLLTGVLGGDDVRWLREGCRPVGHVAYAHVLCEVAPAVSMGVGSGRQRAHP